MLFDYIVKFQYKGRIIEDKGSTHAESYLKAMNTVYSYYGGDESLISVTITKEQSNS